MTDPHPEPGRKPTTAAAPVAALAAAAACLWGSSRMTWLLVSSADGLGPVRVDRLLGGAWFDALTPLALVLSAAIAAVSATRGGWRRACGIVIALLGGAAAVPPGTLLTHTGLTAHRAAAALGLPARAQVTAVRCVPLPAVLALVGAIVAFLAGVALARTRGGGGLSGRFRTPAARRAEALSRIPYSSGNDGRDVVDTSVSRNTEVSERLLWDAIDAGRDPTGETDERTW